MDHVPPRRQHDDADRLGHGPGPLKRALLAALALLLAAGFVALGVWQVERRAWKLDLIARVDARVHAPAAPIGLDADPKANEYRHVRLAGNFVPGRDSYVQALTERGAGFWLLTPLRTPEGTVLVNRGFVPSTRLVNTPAATTVTGLLRVSEPKGTLLRANDPAANRWYSRDVAAIARARGIGSVAPFFVDADATPGGRDYPLGGLTVVRFNNNHLVYALTWFALAGLCGFAVLLVLRRPR